MKPFVVVLGPCALESRELALQVGEKVAALASRFPQARFYFKGSFDKANRSSAHSPRGPGLALGKAILAEVKAATGLPVVTDFHLPEQAAALADTVEVLQVPAFLCRQTDLLEAAAKSGCIVKVKKGQFLSPMEMRYVVDKLEQFGAKEIWLTERGTTFGYQNLVVDMRSFQMMEATGHRTVFDATHSVQMPGAGQGTTSGRREFIPRLAQAAVAAGAGGLFMETHPRPAEAISDGANQVPLERIEELIENCLRLHAALPSSPMCLDSDNG